MNMGGNNSAPGHFNGDGHCEGVECTGYPGLAEYAIDRDSYVYPQPARTGASDGFKAFIAAVNETLKQLSTVPSVAAMLKSSPGLKAIDPTDPTALVLENEQLSLKFDPATGAISSLLDKGASDGKGGREWVATGQLLGEFVYRTYTQQHDINPYVKQLTPTFNATDTDLHYWPWAKPGMDESIGADPAMPPLANCSRVWPVRLTKAWKSDTTMLLQLALPHDAVQLFGGMGEITLNVSLPPPVATIYSNKASSSVVELTMSWKNKTATRLAESSWVSFVPSVPQPDKGWRLDVLGSPVDPLSVVVNVSTLCYTVDPLPSYDLCLASLTYARLRSVAIRRALAISMQSTEAYATTIRTQPTHWRQKQGRYGWRWSRWTRRWSPPVTQRI
jgi:hypothetical protein